MIATMRITLVRIYLLLHYITYKYSNSDIVFGHDDYVCPTVWRGQLQANQSTSSSAICKCSVQDRICRGLGHSVCGNRDTGVQNSARETMQNRLQKTVCAKTETRMPNRVQVSMQHRVPGGLQSEVPG